MSKQLYYTVMFKSSLAEKEIFFSCIVTLLTLTFNDKFDESPSHSGLYLKIGGGGGGGCMICKIFQTSKGSDTVMRWQHNSTKEEGFQTNSVHMTNYIFISFLLFYCSMSKVSTDGCVKMTYVLGD